MRVLALLAVSASAALLVPTQLAAQTCLGNPSFRVNHLQLAGEALFGVDGTTLLLRGQLGSQVPLSPGSVAQVCPILTAEIGFGPEDIDGLGTNYRLRAFGFGLAFGGVMASTGTIALVPSVSAGFQYRAGLFDGIGGSTTVSDTYGTVGAALGLVMNQALSIRPCVTFPLGVEDGKPVIGIGVALNYGGRR